jgi:16S rRNA (cytidine1402-2'-O)-methyltransferase
LSASFATALAASTDAAATQHYPQGALYVVATPIGNLADITLRALHVLQLVDAVACEDTRHTQIMLRAYGMERPGPQLIALHQHNEIQAAQAVLDLLHLGQRVAYVSDAGTPGISDPGARLVHAVRSAGQLVVPLPGASSVTTLLSVSGVSTAEGAHPEFVFAGFLPSKSADRAAKLHALRQENRAVVLLEAPHRIAALANELASLGERRVTLGRELTKQFEEIVTLRASELAAWLSADPNRLRGEFVLALHPSAAAADQQTDEGLRVLQLLLAELPLKTAVKLASEISGQARNSLYEKALQLKNSEGKPAR